MAPESSGDPVKTQRAQKAPVWMYLGNISCLAGTILMIAAPGNFVRSGETGEEAYSLLWRMYLRCYAEAKGVMEYLFPALLLTVFALIVCKGILKENLGRNTVLLLLGALLSWGAMILSPHYPDRSAFGTMTLLICATLSMTGKSWTDRRKMPGCSMAVPCWYGCGACIFWWNIWDYAGAGSNK